MAERNPFDPQAKEAPGREMRCEDWETLLADALDGVLPASDHAAFHAHGASCATCARLLAEARQGQEWMKFLQGEPEMPGDLMERILSKTSGAVADRPLAVYGAPIPAGTTVLPLPVRRMVWDTRLMMTAAMAFFSIALTLNLAGVRITDLRLSQLTPASLENNLTRQFYGAKSQAVRYYDNLRFVYEVESKMREFRRDEETAPPAAQPAGQEKPATPANPSGNGRKTGGKVEAIPNAAPPAVLWGRRALASGRRPDPPACSDPERRGGAEKCGNCDEVGRLVVPIEDRAQRSLA